MAIYKWFPVRVTWVTLDTNLITLTTAGDTQQLTATVSPANAEDKSVEWISDNTNVATVSQTWLVTCVTPWSCDITVTTVDGWYTASCWVSDWSWWQPWVNTVLYCPLDSTYGYADRTGNHTMVARANANGYWGQPTRDSTGFYYFDGGTIETTQGYTWPQQWTLSVWFKRANKHNTWVQEWVLSAHRGGSFPYHTFAMDVGTNDTVAVVYTSNQNILIYPWNQAIWQWILWTLTYSSTDWAKLYIDWELVDSESPDWTLYQYTEPTCIWGAYVEPYQYYEWYIADVIYEDKVWSAWEVSIWYNQSKSRYWL